MDDTGWHFVSTSSGFSISYHPYIHDQHTKHVVPTLNCVANMYIPDIDKLVHDIQLLRARVHGFWGYFVAN